MATFYTLPVPLGVFHTPAHTLKKPIKRASVLSSAGRRAGGPASPPAVPTGLVSVPLVHPVALRRVLRWASAV